MSVYTPDVWVVLKLSGAKAQEHYRVLAGWYGGYLGGNSWKMNSGIVQIVETEETFDVYGDSGSVYKCPKGCERTSSMTANVLNDLESKSDGVNYIVDMVKMKDVLPLFNGVK